MTDQAPLARTPAMPAPRRSGRRLVAGHAAALVALLCAAAITATPAAAAQLVGNLAALPDAAQIAGSADPAAMLHLHLVLKLRDAGRLSRETAQGVRRDWATLERDFLPSQTDYDAVIAWARNAGLTVTATHRSRLAVEIAAPAATIARVFGVRLATVRAEGETLTEALSEPALPDDIAARLVGINGLQPRLRAHHLLRFAPQAMTASATAATTATTPPFLPKALRTAYRVPAAAQGGSLTTTAILIDTLPQISDLVSYWGITKTPQSISNVTLIQAVAGTLPALSGEETLDAELASGIAPKSKVRVYASRTLRFTDLDNGLRRILSDLQTGTSITQLSISLGACETALSKAQTTTDDQLFTTIAALGVNIFVSSGDLGSRTCGGTSNTVSFYASSPNVTAVGGTTLTLKSTGQIASETAWSGSGGGISTRFAKPSYQAAITATGRGVPDLAAVGDPNTGALIVLNGAQLKVGGTSLSAPVVAGLFAGVNSARITAGKTPIVALNARLYSFAGSTKFRDIKTGNNGGFTAGTGYDFVTGLGSPVMANLLPSLIAVP